MNIRVISDGTAGGTHIFDDDRAEDDREITQWVHAVDWTHEAGKLPACTVTFVAVALNFVGEARASTEAIVDRMGTLAANPPTS